MKQNALLIISLLLAAAFAGCTAEDTPTGDDEYDPTDDEAAIVGDWYDAESKVVTFNSNGTVLARYVWNGTGIGNWSTGNWSINGTYKSLKLMWDGYGPEGYPNSFSIEGDWLFFTAFSRGNCYVFSRASIDDDIWNSTVDALILPKFCEGIE